MTGKTPEEAATRAQTLLQSLELVVKGYNLTISREKTSCMLVCTPQARNQITTPPVVSYSDGSPVQWTTHTKYLGVTYDSSISFTQHVEDLKKRYVKRIALLQALTGTTWGCSAPLLRTVYLTFVLPIVQYGLHVYGCVVTQANFQDLEKLHNTAARVITGLPDTTDTRVLLWEADLKPLRYYRERLACHLRERYLRLPGTTGHKTVTQHAHTNTWIDLAKDAQKRAELFERGLVRAPLQRYSPVPPWSLASLERLCICTHVPGIKKKSEELTEDMYQATQAHLQGRYSSFVWWTYSDGSVADKRGGAGYAVYHSSQLHTPYSKWRGDGGKYATPYHAELVALRQALYELTFAPPAKILFLTDSQSCLQALQGGPERAREQVLCEIWALLQQLCEMGHTVALQWIPSHVGIAGNELADKLAAEGRSKRFEEPLSFSCAKNSHKLLLNMEVDPPKRTTIYWQSKGRSKRLTKPPPPHPHLTRAGEVLLRQLRADRHRLLFDFTEEHNRARCPLCDSPCTLTHLFDCPVARDDEFATLSPREILYWRQCDAIHYLIVHGFLDQDPLLHFHDL